MTILRHFVLGGLCLGQLAHGMFKPSLGIKGFREMMHQREVKTIGDADPTSLYKAYTISVPIDHFHNDSLYAPHTNDTFELRYWFDRSNYKEGAGPIIVLQGGETDGTERLAYLQKGIVAQLTNATNGLGVVLEHRYYGASVPYGNYSTDNLRFLTTEQALADMAYFAQNVVFEGLEHLDLTAPKTGYFAYGGSYAGGLVAFLRKLYPDVYWGAIASSATTEAIYDFWRFFDAQRLYMPSMCREVTEELVKIVDNLLLRKVDTSADLPGRVKTVFGLGNLTHDNDFAFLLSHGVTSYVVNNWDPEESSPEFGYYCNNITSANLLYPSLDNRTTEVQYLMNSAGYGDWRDTALPNQVLNFIGYVDTTAIQLCRGHSQDKCFSNYNPTFHQKDDIAQIWRPWSYQFCTEWGLLQTGTLGDFLVVPIISQLVDVDYKSIVCREAFHISTPPKVERINRYGGFNISYPRLAFIDGEKDNWRSATPHAFGLAPRNATRSEPFVLIPGAHHHWDENGVFPNETTPSFPPSSVCRTQEYEALVVKGWFEEWKQEKGSK